MVTFGGYSFPFGSPSATYYGDTWRLRWVSPVTVQDPLATAMGLTLSTPRPNPTRHRIEIDYEAPVNRGLVELELFDVHGRRVLRRVLAPADGRGHVALDLGDERPAALYFARVSCGGRSVTRRVVVCR
jgi:hypothetical protein